MATTKDDGYDGLRAAALATVREGYATMRAKLDEAGVVAEVEAMVSPAAAFASLAQSASAIALHQRLRGGGEHGEAKADAIAWELLAGFARAASLTWAEVRS